MQNVQCKMQNVCLIFCILYSSFFIAGCSIPNLESQSCIEARSSVREFYSQYFATDAETRSKEWNRFEKYISPNFNWDRGSNWEVNPFLLTNDWPKAFRDGECKEISSDRTEFRVLLFWKDDVRSEQRPINVETVKIGDKWLIEKVIRLER